MNQTQTLLLEGAQLPKASCVEGMPDPASCSPPHEAADARLIVTNHDGQILAHAALWWTETPPMEGEQVGAIGGFAAWDMHSAITILDAACAELRARSCSIAVGPMNGNTWRHYRFVTQNNNRPPSQTNTPPPSQTNTPPPSQGNHRPPSQGNHRPPFLLEPTNPAAWTQWWLDVGFTDLAHYSSSLMPLPCEPATSPRIRERLKQSGIVVRELNPSHYEHELNAIYEVSIKSFSSNFLYTPLEKNAFMQAYLKVREHVDPRFVRIAEKNGQAVGFVFGIPDLNAIARDEPPALIVKTLAVDPGSRCAGLGSFLVDTIQEAAAQAGLRESIHALQHETNTSLKITKRNAGKKIRQYTLYQKTL